MDFLAITRTGEGPTATLLCIFCCIFPQQQITNKRGPFIKIVLNILIAQIGCDPTTSVKRAVYEALLPLYLMFIGEQWSLFGSDGMVIFFWVTQPSPLTDFQPPDHCFQWFFDGFGVIEPMVSMVFNGYGPFVQQCDGFNGSFTSKLSQN